VAYRRDTPKLVGSFSQALALRRRRDKGKPAARRARKVYGPPGASLWEVAGLSNGDGGGQQCSAPIRKRGSGCDLLVATSSTRYKCFTHLVFSVSWRAGGVGDEPGTLRRSDTGPRYQPGL
jgi:hypothetical protein